MKFWLSTLGILLFALGRPAPVQQPESKEACGFKVSDSAAKPVITGPEEVTSRVYVVEQPDSPVEILSIDFKDSVLSIGNGREWEQLRCTMKIRNRSDQWIRGWSGQIRVASRFGGGGPGFGELPGQLGGLAPGQEREVRACGGSGNGDAPNDFVRVLVYVSRVDIGDCFYAPSARVPYRLGVTQIRP